jgi:purine-cytosine permease-like protein
MAIESHSIDWVPERDRHGKVIDQGKFWFLGNFQFFTIAIGFIGPSMGLALGWTALAGGLGIVIGTLFQAFHANQGAELGLPQMIQSRAQFGYRGVILPLCATLVTYVGFNVVDLILITDGVSALLGWNKLLLGFGISALAAILAIYGHDWLHRVFRLLFWINLPLFALLTAAVALGGISHAAPPELGFTWVAFCTQLATGASYNITYATYVSDYSRYLPPSTPRHQVILSVFCGSAGSAIWLIALGAWRATRISGSDALLSLNDAGNRLMPGLGGLLAVCSIAALTATMGMNAYSGMLTVVTGIDSVRKLRPTRRLRIGVILALSALWLGLTEILGGDAIGAISATFVVMLYLLVPWTAINLTDFYFVRRGHYAVTHLFTPTGIYGRWRRQGLLAYGLGFAISLPFVVIPDLATGPLARQLGGIDIGWLVGLAATAAIYLYLTRDHDHQAEAPALQQSRDELQGLNG